MVFFPHLCAFLFFLVHHHYIVHIYIYRLVTKKNCLSIEKKKGKKKLHQYLMLFRVSFCSFPSITTTTIIHPNECSSCVQAERRCRDFFFLLVVIRFFFSFSFFSPSSSAAFLRVLHVNSSPSQLAFDIV